MEELAPCNFCTSEESIMVQSGWGVAFECCKCGASGSIKSTKEEARKAWNTRNGVTYKKATEPSGVDNGGDVVWFGGE